MIFNQQSLVAAISLLTILTLTESWAANCPPPPTSVEPNVHSKVQYDQKSKLYKYDYTVSNARSALLAIKRFIILNNSQPEDIQTPAHWHQSYKNLPDLAPNIVWSTSELDPNDPNANNQNYTGPQLRLFYAIKPGSSLRGFSFKSPYPPGPQRYFVEGDTDVPVSAPTDQDDEATPNCPGFLEGPRFDTMVEGMVEAPISPGTLPVAIRLRTASGERHNRELKPDRAQGKVGVILLSSKSFDPSTVSLASIQFGPGKAPVLSSRPIESFSDMREDFAEWELERSVNYLEKEREDRKEKKSLLLIFDLASVGIRCGIDHAVFLIGKTTDGKSILGGIPISTRECQRFTGKTNQKDSDHR